MKNKKILMGILISVIVLVSGCINEKVIPVTNEILPSPFGVAFGEGSSNLDNFMNYIHDLGVRRTKVSFFWHKIEPEDDKYNWKEVDAYVNQLQPGDKALLNVFTTGWATNEESPKGATFKNEECKEKYREFIVDLVEHTQGKITYWQRDTEPASARHYPTERFEEYVEAQKIFYEAVKSVQPDAIVIGVNANGNFKDGEPVNAEFFDCVIRYGKDYFDMLDVRLYEDKYDIPMKVEWFRNKMKEYGYEKPIVCTEFGGPDPREFPEQYQSLSKVIQPEYASGNIDEAFAKLDSMREEGLVPPEIDMFLIDASPELEEKRNRIHCRDLIQRHLIILDSGVKELWYWNLQSSGLHPIFGKMRLMDPENWKKLPPYYCYQRMIQHIGDVKAVKRISTENENIYLFNLTMQDDSTKYVIWERRDMFYGEDQPAVPFELEIDWKKVKITDVFGNEEIRSADNGVLSLNITDTPIYIEDEETSVQINVDITKPEEGLSFIGVDFHPPNNLDINYLDKFSELGIDSYGFEFLIWNVVEPNAPVNEIHTYNWSYPDEMIRAIEQAGGRSLITIWVASNWANRKGFDYGERGFRPSIPPKQEYWDDFAEFVNAVVERYDHDGIDDMSGLKYAHIYYQFEGEAEVHWQAGGGTKEEYVEMLEIFYNAVKQANPNALVFTEGFNLGDFFDNNPTLEEINSAPLGASSRKSKEFVEYLLANSQYYDVVGTNCNYHYRGLPARMRWIRSFTNKQVWCVDMAAGYQFGHSIFQDPLYPIDKYPYKNESEIEDILRNGGAEFEEIAEWASAEQAKHVFKKIVASAASGFGKAYLQWVIEIPKPIPGWVMVGLLEDNIPNRGMISGTPRPVYYTLKLFNEKIGNFDSVTDLNPLPEGIDPINWTWMVKFTKDNNSVFILWSDGGEKTIDLSEYISTPNAKTTHITTELDSNGNPVYPPDQIVPADSITVDETPIFVEEIE